MRNSQHESKVALPREIADWMGVPDAVAATAPAARLDVPQQRGWRERLKDLMEG